MNTKTTVTFLLALLLQFLALATGDAIAGDEPIADLRGKITAEFAGRVPKQWGENVSGVRTRLKTSEKVLALTLDACGSRTGKGFDADLLGYLEQEQIPATLFVNARWIDANPVLFRKLAANPLFEIANHGLLHRPASVTGRSAYGIQGTANIGELVDEIEMNARKIEELTGKRPRFYRSGTAYYDEIAVAVSRRLGHEVTGYSVLGDAGATYRREQVKKALLGSQAGDIIILHMNHPESGTAPGVRSALPELKRRGFSFVRLSECELQ